VRLGAFPPDAPFLPSLAKLWLADTAQDKSDGLIILPSRRAAMSLAGAFLGQSGGRALLLPRIIAIGAIDEAGLSLAGALETPLAIAPLQRQAILARLILARGGRDGAPQTLSAAWALAADLAKLLDEADYAEVDLAAALPDIVAAELAAHWQTTLDFLGIITQAWPAILAEMGMVNPASRQRALLDAQAAAWAENPPAHRVWLVAREANPAVARLARRVAGLPQGQLVLPGYDAALSAAAWAACGDNHAQSGIARLLGAIGARRDEILLLPAALGDARQGRASILSRALLPAAELSEWQQAEPLEVTGLTKLSARDEAENAAAIAMILRDALEQPRRTAALVTPDRGLAIRVAAALKRFGITADDSAGEPLAQTPPAGLLRLLAGAVVADFAPLPLLALLQHPLAQAGLAPGRCREAARRLERAALRGPRPEPGFAGIAYRLRTAEHQAERDFLDHIEIRVRPALLPEAINPAAAIRALIEAGEQLAATDQVPGAAILWSGEAGAALSDWLLEALAAVETLPDIRREDLAAWLDALLAGPVVRRPRAKDGHPRIAIWGLDEASLQSVDVLVMGGLVEGVWPAAAEPGPWLSRPMRVAAGLPSPEAAIGRAAHDFFALACACPTAVLAAPARRERAPAVPARWLTRLDAMLAGAGMTLPAHEAAGWAAALDQPRARVPYPAPRPRPPAPFRPKTLSISDVATLLADPYAIYVQKILKIRKLAPLDEESDAAQFGDILHAGLARFFAASPDFEAPDAAVRLALSLETQMREARPRAGLQTWWAARLHRIADWIVEAEAVRRREHGPPAAFVLEASGQMPVAGGFELQGRADRIERRQDGGVFILDYKTGTVPSTADVEAGTAPQLPLEAVMAQAGAFGEAFAAEVTALAYIKVSGRAEAGAETIIKPKHRSSPALIDEAAAALPKLFAKFADPETPFLAAPHPGRATYDDPYAGVSRRAEWGGGE
jgi:ATP-dependent helicase/nuclease subunit B